MATCSLFIEVLALGLGYHWLNNLLPEHMHVIMELRRTCQIWSGICSLWPKSGTAKCITSRPTFKSGTARAVPLRCVPTPRHCHWFLVIMKLIPSSCFQRFCTFFQGDQRGLESWFQGGFGGQTKKIFRARFRSPWSPTTPHARRWCILILVAVFCEQN